MLASRGTKKTVTANAVARTCGSRAKHCWQRIVTYEHCESRALSSTRVEAAGNASRRPASAPASASDVTWRSKGVSQDAKQSPLWRAVS